MDIDKLKQHYQQLPDFEIIHISNYKADQLPPEALKILNEEIRVRNLNNNLNSSIAALNNQLTDEELEEYVNLIRNLPDPITGQTDHKLNATTVSKALSILVYTQKTKTIYIGTPEKIDKALLNGTIFTILLGWWAIPFGIIYSANCIAANSTMRGINYHDKPTDILVQFVIKNIGYIVSNKKDISKLQALIVSTNS